METSDYLKIQEIRKNITQLAYQKSVWYPPEVERLMNDMFDINLQLLCEMQRALDNLEKELEKHEKDKSQTKLKSG